MAGPNLTFNSFALQEAYREVSDTIERFPENLNCVSEDVKKLEKYLEQSGVRVPVQHEIGTSCRESLRWDEAPDSDRRWRIMYYSVADDVLGWGIPETTYKPLIETPAPIRLRAYPHLPDLLRAVGQQTFVEPIEIPF
jgi:hypothetical protein